MTPLDVITWALVLVVVVILLALCVVILGTAIQQVRKGFRQTSDGDRKERQ